MMPKRGLDGVALATMAAGMIFSYAAIKGYSVLQTVQLVISGRAPTGQFQAQPIGTPMQAGGSVAQNAPGSVSNPSSGQWSHDGLMKLWQQAGGSAATANNAACHAIQESSGNASITSPNPDGGTNV